MASGVAPTPSGPGALCKRTLRGGGEETLPGAVLDNGAPLQHRGQLPPPDALPPRPLFCSESRAGPQEEGEERRGRGPLRGSSDAGQVVGGKSRAPRGHSPSNPSPAPRPALLHSAWRLPELPAAVPRAKAGGLCSGVRPRPGGSAPCCWSAPAGRKRPPPSPAPSAGAQVSRPRRAPPPAGLPRHTPRG